MFCDSSVSVFEFVNVSSVVRDDEVPSVVSTCLRINCAVFSSDFFRKCSGGLQGGGVVAEEGKCVEAFKACVKELITFLGQKIVWIDIPELHQTLCDHSAEIRYNKFGDVTIGRYLPNAVQGARIGPLLSGPMNEVMSCIMGNLYPQVHNAAVFSLLQVRATLLRASICSVPTHS
jgi:hypothetical protein